MNNPTLLLLVGKTIDEDRRRARLEENRIKQAVQASRGTAPRLRDQLYTRAGDFLIQAGQRLQERARPVGYPATANQSQC